MFVKSIATTLAILVASASIASAQSPTRIQQFKAWGAYSYKAQNGTLCYVLAVPTEKLPATVDHGDVFFIVSQRPGQNISYEPQVMVGYPMKADAKVDHLVRIARQLERLGVDVIEAPHEMIGSRLLDAYLAIKRKGAIG